MWALCQLPYPYAVFPCRIRMPYANPYACERSFMRIHHAFLTSSTAFFSRSVADLWLKTCLCLYWGAVIYIYSNKIWLSLPPHLNYHGWIKSRLINGNTAGGGSIGYCRRAFNRGIPQPRNAVIWLNISEILQISYREQFTSLWRDTG